MIAIAVKRKLSCGEKVHFTSLLPSSLGNVKNKLNLQQNQNSQHLPNRASPLCGHKKLMLQIVGMRINFTDMRYNQYWWWVEAKRLHKKWAFLSICGSHLSSVDSGWKASYYSGLPNWLLLPGDNTTSAGSSTYNTNRSVSIVVNIARGTTWVNLSD